MNCNCALCSIKSCNHAGTDKAARNCPGSDAGSEKLNEMYLEKGNFEIAKESSLLVEESYGMQTRLEETMDFANRCGFKNIGLAFCIGLKDESKMLSKVLTHNGFKVHSVICKNGSISKELIGIEGAAAAMCNPIGQALILNEAKTDLNIVVGLCVGHDSLFIKYSEAPVTVFAVKDRVLAHNPLAAVYQAEAYYKDKFFPKKQG